MAVDAREELFAQPQVVVTPGQNGATLLSNALPLDAYPSTILSRLDHWAETTPDRIFLAERRADGWNELTYGAALGRVTDLARRILTLPVSSERPLLILSANSIEHALLVLASMRIGVPAAIVSSAYAVLSGQAEKLEHALKLLTPGAIYLGEGGKLAAAITAVNAENLPILVPADAEAPGLQPLASLAEAPIPALDAAAAKIHPDTVAKLLFTSGSTGLPKAVTVTQRMMCSNMAGLAKVWTFLNHRPPVMLDWLPWNHIFGGNCCFNLALYFGGSFYIDHGKPTPKGIATTIENMRMISPSLHFNVPIGIEALLPALETDPEFAAAFFSRLDFIFGAGAAMPPSARQRLEAVAQKTPGRVPPIIGAWGSTETAPFSTVIYFSTPIAENLGVPLPGTTIKMVPNGGKHELRVKGPNVTPGYWRQPEMTAAAFDEDGFYRIGDAGKLADPEHPEAGIVFDGRTAENFKLTSGTWVNVGMLRLAVIAAAKPLISDVVVTGHNRDEIGVLVVPNPVACRQFLGAAANGLSDAEIAGKPELSAEIWRLLTRYNLEQSGSSTIIRRFLVLDQPPSADHNEITEKGYLNQRAMLERRASLVERLYRGDGPGLPQ